MIVVLLLSLLALYKVMIIHSGNPDPGCVQVCVKSTQNSWEFNGPTTFPAGTVALLGDYSGTMILNNPLVRPAISLQVVGLNGGMNHEIMTCKFSDID